MPAILAVRSVSSMGCGWRGSDRATSNRPCRAPTAACSSRGTSPSRIAGNASCVGSARRGPCIPDSRNGRSRRYLGIRARKPANELLLTFVKAEASAVAFTCRISQTDDLGVFAVTLGAARFRTHGDLPPEELPLPIRMSDAVLVVDLREGRRCETSRHHRSCATCPDVSRHHPCVYPV